MGIKEFTGISVQVVFENDWPEDGTFSILIPKIYGKRFEKETDDLIVTPVYSGKIVVPVENVKLEIGLGTDPDTVSFQILDRKFKEFIPGRYFDISIYPLTLNSVQGHKFSGYISDYTGKVVESFFDKPPTN